MNNRVMKRKVRTSVSKKEAADKWSGNYGMKNLYVSGATEAEGDIVNLVKQACEGVVCEVGCGDGRVATHFPANQYIGIDISPLAIAAAKKRCPSHHLRVVGYDDEYPDADTFIFYTVLLHVPDDVLKSVFARARAAGAKRIIIYEVMVGWIRDYARHDNFHRNPGEFVEASGFQEKELHFVKSRFFPWNGNILILEPTK